MPTSDYIPRQLTNLRSDTTREPIDEEHLLEHGTPAIVLGEPGMGKTELLKRLAAKVENAVFIRAARLLRRAPLVSEKNKLLVIDGLDEVAALAEGDPLQNVLAALSNSENPQFVLSCRSADWRNVSSKVSISEDYGKEPVVWRIEPVTLEKSIEYLIAEGMDETSSEQLVGRLREQGLTDLLGNPLTLKLLSALAKKNEGRIPRSRSGLFESAIDVLWHESNEDRTNSALAKLSKDEVLNAAGSLCAVLLLTGKSSIRDDHIGLQESQLLLADVVQLENTLDFRTTISSRLFQTPDENGEVLPLHRTIAEYLGARWLATKCGAKDGNRVASRIQSIMSVDGMVPASLRGLNAWLALHSPFTSSAIAADPYGVLKRGGSVCLNRSRSLYKWISALRVMPQPGLAAAR